jgi:hypothetical protein
MPMAAYLLQLKIGCGKEATQLEELLGKGVRVETAISEKIPIFFRI